MHRPARLVSALSVSVVLLIVLSGLASSPTANGGSTAGAARSPYSESAAERPAQQLALAQSTLGGGLGPALGQSVRCDAASTALQCASAQTSATIGGALGTWANVTSKVGAGPSGRWAASMVWDASDGYVLLFGGIACSATCLPRDTWTFSNGAWTNITASVTGTPPGAELSGLAYDPSTGKVILFGGEAPTSGLQAYTWAYQAKTWTNITSTAGTPPPGRIFPAMATDSTDGQVLLTGGEVSGGFGSDTWVFKGGTWTNVTSIAGSSGHLEFPLATDDPAEHGVLLFGPEIGNQTRAATLVYSAGAWHNLTSTLTVSTPSVDLWGAAAYDPAVQGVVALVGLTLNSSGGETFAYATWEFANGAWTNVTALVGSPPNTLIFASAAADPNSDALISFGGDEIKGPAESPYTFILSGAALVTASVAKSIIDAGMSDAFTASVVGGLAPDTLSWNFADGSANVSAASPTHTYAGSGVYVATVTVTSFVGAVASATVSVFVNPALSVAVNASPTAGSATTFTSGITGGTGPFTYAWSFGDTSTSSTSTLADPSHVYGSSGTFTATVRVTDSAGANVTKTLSVVVAAAPSTASTSLTSGTGLGLLIGIIVLVVIVLALAILLMRKPKNPVMMAPAAPPVAPYTPPPPPPTAQ